MNAACAIKSVPDGDKQKAAKINCPKIDKPMKLFIKIFFQDILHQKR